jgi:hypothetical protein
MGRTEDARSALTEVQEVAAGSFVPPFLLAVAHLGAGDRAGALEWLERGHEERDAYLVFMKASPWMDPLRSEPRFQALIEKMRFP